MHISKNVYNIQVDIIVIFPNIYKPENDLTIHAFLKEKK